MVGLPHTAPVLIHNSTLFFRIETDTLYINTSIAGKDNYYIIINLAPVLALLCY